MQILLSHRTSPRHITRAALPGLMLSTVLLSCGAVSARAEALANACLVPGAHPAPAIDPAKITADTAAPGFWQWAPTPPMGWNSYDTYGDSVTEQETMANAQFMKDHLLKHGWQYVVVDFRWYDPVGTNEDGKLTKERLGAKLTADEYGRLFPAENRFPSATGSLGFKPMADRMHAMGLKFGIHMMRGIPRQAVLAKTPIEGGTFTAEDAGDQTNTCRWCPDMFGVRNNPAGQAWYDSVFRLYASWGLDFIKVDDLSLPYAQDEIAMIRKAIDRSGRRIVFSTSPGPTAPSHADDIRQEANMWRVSGDFWDVWKKLNAQFDLLHAWEKVGGAGHYPDADMIPFGHIGIRSWANARDRQTRFTHDEQRTLMSLWTLSASPLMLGFNLPDNDDWTTALLTNDEVIAVDQDRLDSAATRVAQANGLEVWVRPLADGSRAVGLFNRSDAAAKVTLQWDDAGLKGKQTLRDLWSHTDLGRFEGAFSSDVPAHGSLLLRARAK